MLPSSLPPASCLPLALADLLFWKLACGAAGGAVGGGTAVFLVDAFLLPFDSSRFLHEGHTNS